MFHRKSNRLSSFGEIDDISQLETIDNDIILDCIKERYEHNSYYTYIGDSVIAVNPCQDLPIYTSTQHEIYTNIRDRSSQPAHIFWAADFAHRSLRDGNGMCLVVTGDSGAGKTESTKLIIKHLVQLDQSSSTESDLISKLEKINLVLEFFGNAETSLNENSSRFAKLVEISYTENDTIAFAKIEGYILERFRVTEPSHNEKNFHIFYALFAGMSEFSLQELDLEDLSDYRILTVFNNGEEEKAYERKYFDMIRLFTEIGVEQQLVDQIIKILAAILHLTNVEFDETHDGTVGIMDEKSLEHINSCRRLLNLEEEDFDEMKRFLLSSDIRDEVRLKRLPEAEDGRDALARELYSCVFYGIIDVINTMLSTNHTGRSKKKAIRILDISGFENLEHQNSLEQLLINTVNENLQQYFIKQAFIEEKRDFQLEGISQESIHYIDNKDVIDLLCKPPGGIIPVLNDSISINPSVEQFINNLDQIHRDNSNFETGSYSTPMFIINHYATKVSYDATNFFKKNRDSVSSQLGELVQRSDNLFIRNYFQLGSYSTTSRNRGGRSSFRGHGSLSSGFSGSSKPGKLVGRVADSFQKSLKRMMDKIQTLQPIFIRCIKPNINLQPSKFNSETVRIQLEKCGIMDAAKVRCCGYPIRISYKDFAKRYAVLHEPEIITEPPKSICLKILNSVHIYDYGEGKTKIFLKTKHRDHLEAKTVEQEKYIARKKKEKEEELIIKQALIAKEALLVKQDNANNKFSKLERSDSGLSSTSSFCKSSLSTIQQFNDEDESTMKINLSVLDEDMQENFSEQEEKGTKDLESELPKEAKKKKPKKSEDDNSKRMAWETMCITERDCENSNEFEQSVRRMVRFVMYILLAICVCGSSSISNISLYWMSQSISSKSSSADVLFIQLMWCLTVPMVFRWLACLFKTLFSTKGVPSKKAILLLLLIDICQTCGRCLMVLLVMPYLRPLESAICCLVVCQLPALLCIIKEFTARPKNDSSSTESNVDPTIRQNPESTSGSVRVSRTKFGCVIFVSLLALMVQCGAPVILMSVGTLSQLSSRSDISPLRVGGLFIFVCFCVTISWWENFAFGKLPICGFDLGILRQNLRRARVTSYIFSGPIQILISGCMLHYILENTFDESFQHFGKSFGNMFFNWKMIGRHFEEFGLMYVQMIATNMCVYCSGIACRLRMQNFGFSLPIVIVPIVTAVLTSLYTPLDVQKWFKFNWLRVSAPSSQEDWITVGLAVAVYFSYLFISRHIWFPKSERMAKLEKLFSFGQSDPVFTDISLALKRRQDEAENHDIKMKRTEFKVPNVYICATMWHEIQQEMLQLLKSLFRLDFDICKRYLANKKFGTFIDDIYTAEIHIIFDDAFQTDEKSKQRVMNPYVEQLIKLMPMACSSVSKGSVLLNPVKTITTPYGGRLEWIMPGGTKMEVHLKDKSKIRHKKRWSQIMYMYYLLGHKLLRHYQSSEDLLRESKTRSATPAVRPYSSMLNKLPVAVVEEAANTFVMALDGDVDFGPEAVRLLIDRMKKNRDVAAVCGRIHPIGKGPMVWYQQFEYSVGHWLQKATENVLGCVLCCPGCFSLFRGLALMDDNVMRQYAIDATEAKHFIQYEQGEDRWLCTLLLQQGYKIDYCAGSDAFTYAPETFNDFYIQRRRWSPSTMANIMDLLGSWKNTSKMNNNISTPFMFYQFIMMASSILAPGTVTFMIAGSYTAVLGLNSWQAYLLSTLPVLAYIILCLKAKTETQVAVAAVLSAVYSIVMVIVSVGTVINISQEKFLTPNVIFLVGVSAIFVVTAFVHPNELMTLVHGILYYLTVPSTFVFLTVFFLCNLNVVSWGTRETSKKPEDEDELGMPAKSPPSKSKLMTFIDSLGIKSIFDELRSFIRQTLGKDAESKTNVSSDIESGLTTSMPSGQCTPAINVVKKKVTIRKPKKTIVMDPNYWKTVGIIADGSHDDLSEAETMFWQKLITSFLLPIKENKERQEQIASDLISIRNNVVFAYFLLNFMFTLVILQLDLKQEVLREHIYIAKKYEPVSVLFLGIFAILIVTQFIAMLIHRWGTFLLLISSTKINWFSTDNKDDTSTALQEIEEMQKGELEIVYRDESDSESEQSVFMDPPDYSDDEDDENEDTQPMSQYERIVEKEHNRRRKSIVTGPAHLPPGTWATRNNRTNKSIAIRNLYQRTSINPMIGHADSSGTHGLYNRYRKSSQMGIHHQRHYISNNHSRISDTLASQSIPECDYE